MKPLENVNLIVNVLEAFSTMTNWNIARAALTAIALLQKDFFEIKGKVADYLGSFEWSESLFDHVVEVSKEGWKIKADHHDGSYFSIHSFKPNLNEIVWIIRIINSSRENFIFAGTEYLLTTITNRDLISNNDPLKQSSGYITPEMKEPLMIDKFLSIYNKTNSSFPGCTPEEFAGMITQDSLFVNKNMYDMWIKPPNSESPTVPTVKLTEQELAIKGIMIGNTDITITLANDTKILITDNDPSNTQSFVTAIQLDLDRIILENLVLNGVVISRVNSTHYFDAVTQTTINDDKLFKVPNEICAIVPKEIGTEWANKRVLYQVMIFTNLMTITYYAAVDMDICVPLQLIEARLVNIEVKL